MFHSHCIRFLREEEYQPPGYKLEPGAPAPDTVCIKDFICWYIDSSAGCGRASKNKEPTDYREVHVHLLKVFWQF